MSQNDVLFDRAKQTIPGGVNSPVRAFKAVGGTPRFVTKGDGAYFWDADGKRYIDYIGSWGPMILGHRHPAVTAAVLAAVLASVCAPGLAQKSSWAPERPFLVMEIKRSWYWPNSRWMASSCCKTVRPCDLALAAISAIITAEATASLSRTASPMR